MFKLMFFFGFIFCYYFSCISPQLEASASNDGFIAPVTSHAFVIFVAVYFSIFR